MKPWVAVSLSESTAARLSRAAQDGCASKSAIVEAALSHFLAPEAASAKAAASAQLDAITRQLDQLHCDLQIVGEAVAHQARFLLAVTPALSAADEAAACTLGAARFDEFAAQVARRVRLGTSLINETVERVTRSGSERPPIKATGRAPRRDPTAPDRSGRAVAKSPVPMTSEGERNEHGAELASKRTVRTPSQLRFSSPRTEARPPGDRPNWMLVVRVFLPFAAAYYLSYLFRTIGATIAGPLASEFGLKADDLGLLTSVYFLTFAAAQIPIGVWLDRYGPRRVQSLVLLAAAIGAVLFAASSNFMLLLLGRALIGLGASAALTAGLKAVVLWFPAEQAPVLNGLMIMLAAFGAMTATLPSEYMLVSIGWRGLFQLLSISAVGCALTIFLVVPRSSPSAEAKRPTMGLRAIYADPRFWRLAPLSATCIGSAWALQGLWAAQWLSDVERLDRSGVIRTLFLMALASSVGAMGLGIAVQKLRRYGVGPRKLLSLFALVSFVAQLAVVLRVPIPSSLPWMVIAALGTATVLSYAVLAEYFPKELAGRANGALNLFHIGCAFLVQSAIGLVVQQWAPQQGHYPEISYQTAFGANLVVQLAAWIWFNIRLPSSTSGGERRGD
ncbi:MFS transporter [Bradyrhizobium sp. STM 3562]|uniref:MFS transporter n=1 Tax=Bradyrhizobium sp. STM 3562 TaxID=578924 RepID=UPI00388CF896